ncbi:MAG: D-2-hydroxyacid dehydrogenase, partial [Microthrixaceae bacterium]|nr:D-2-hydroxyacid dehydrogenase [Microthrixaceae bacterium]
DGTYRGDPEGLEIFCFSVDLADNEDSLMQAGMLLLADSLQWVQAPGAGMEHEIWGQLLERGVRLSNAAGVHAEPIAQYVFTYVLNDLRQVDRHREMQADRTWRSVVSDDLTSKSIGIVGMGGIGAAVARIAKAFGMHVMGLRRGEIVDPNVDVRLGPDQLPTLLAQSDYVVLALPLTEETTGLIDSDALGSMRGSAVLINVARGAVVDEPALISALEARTIRAAVLDVTTVEPLEEDSPLWSLDNCVITPHDAGYSPLAGERLGELFTENLALFRAGEPLRNEILAEPAR